MSKKYDLQLIVRSIQYLLLEELSTVFAKKEILEDLLVVSFDDKYLHIFENKNNRINITEIPHEESITDESKKGWSAYLRQRKHLYEYIPTQLQGKKIISGGLYSDFSRIQKEKGSIYSSEESYICTIIHEFAHVYFNSVNPFYYADKDYNLSLLALSKKLFSGNEIENEYQIELNSLSELSEIFSFCVEYSFAKKYAPRYFKKMNNYFTNDLDFLLKKEKEKDLTREDSVLSDSHTLSFVLGRLILEKYPRDWSKRLLKRTLI